MKAKPEAEVLVRLDEQIRTVRGQKVILASDLAAIYGVETKALNRAVKRNVEKFPADFVFLVTREEVANLKCQIGTSSAAPASGTAEKEDRVQAMICAKI